MHEDTSAVPPRATTAARVVAAPPNAAAAPSAVEPPSAPASARRDDVAPRVYLHVERLLRSRTAPSGTRAAKVEERLKRRAARLWGKLKARPAVGVVLTGALGLALATAVGAAELLVAVSAAYAAYLVLREGVSPAVALKEIVRLDEPREVP